jgi:hypothetical protein
VNRYPHLCKLLGVKPGEPFQMVGQPHQRCLFRITEEKGLESRVGTKWIKSTQLEKIISGEYGDVLRWQ